MLGGSGQSALSAGASPTEASRDDTAVNPRTNHATPQPNLLKTQHLKAARPPLGKGGEQEGRLL